MPPSIALLVATCLCIRSAAGEYIDRPPKPIIIDTDIFSDVDDVGALAIANVLHNSRLANLEAVMINTGSKYGSLAASAINTYFRNGEVPIGAIRPLTNETFHDTYYYKLGEYASKVAHNFPQTLETAEDTETPVSLYRSVLASAANASLTIISIGFLTNLADLLASKADEQSSMSGVDLVAAKVEELVVMGGRYPSGWEFNFAGHDPQRASHVLRTWPSNVPITYSGAELGENILSGQDFALHTLPDSPVLSAYQWYGDRCNTVGRSYDPVTVLYAILGLEKNAEYGLYSPFEYANEYGYNALSAEDGTNGWVDDDSVTNQHWLSLKDRCSNQNVSEMLNMLLAKSWLWSDSCFGVCTDGGVRMQG